MDAQEIRRLRESFGETQEEFARRLGLETKGAVCHLELGRKTPKGPLLVLLRLLARLGPKKFPKNLAG